MSGPKELAKLWREISVKPVPEALKSQSEHVEESEIQNENNEMPKVGDSENDCESSSELSMKAMSGENSGGDELESDGEENTSAISGISKISNN
jgi:hypothetical protein